MTGEADVADEKALWRGHCREAVRKFLMHAVVIDNQPILDPAETSGPTAMIATIADEGMGDVYPEPSFDTPEGGGAVDKGQPPAMVMNSTTKPDDLREDTYDAKDSGSHNLNVREISDAFAEQEIACAFVFPTEQDDDEDKIFKRILAASISADIVIIDWHLRGGNSALTQKILTALAKKDVAENGRLRLICVYTGQPDIGVATMDSVAALTAGGLNSDRVVADEGCAYGKHHCLLVLNKQDVHGVDLPERILDALTELADGILPNFALAAVAAIRRNVHHIITRFSSDLDSAYVANRLITDPPSEVSELLRELFVSECDTALGLEQVADHFLSEDRIKNWFAKTGQPASIAKFSVEIVKPTRKGRQQTENRELIVDKDLLISLLRKGIADFQIVTDGCDPVEFPEISRCKVSKALHNNKDNHDGERRFARFAALKREAFGNTKLTSNESWRPSLTLGTLLCQITEEDQGQVKKYYYCLTPACDTVRIKKDDKRNFLLLELEEGKRNTNLIVLEPGGRQRKLFINPKPIKIQTFIFTGDAETGRVLASLTHDGDPSNPMFYFNTTGEPQVEFLWLGEVRRNRANRDMAELNRNWLRLGIKDSEYLRLAGKSRAEI